MVLGNRFLGGWMLTKISSSNKVWPSSYRNTWYILWHKDIFKWFLIISERPYSICTNSSHFLSRANLLFDVSQDSVMGPVFFTIYTISLGRIIQRLGLTYHLYATDTQLYMTFKPSDVTSKYDAISRIKACVADIWIWMDGNFLKLNDKTELLIITTREELSKISDISTSPSHDPPRNLGVIFNSTCCLDAHIAKLCRNINFNLHLVERIRKYLERPTTDALGLL